MIRAMVVRLPYMENPLNNQHRWKARRKKHTIALIMLWLYFCMYIMMMTVEFNVFLEAYRNGSEEETG